MGALSRSFRVRCLVGCLDGRVSERGVLRVDCLDGCLDGVVPPQSKALPGFEGVNIDTVRGLRRVGEATRQA